MSTNTCDYQAVLNGIIAQLKPLIRHDPSLGRVLARANWQISFSVEDFRRVTQASTACRLNLSLRDRQLIELMARDVPPKQIALAWGASRDAIFAEGQALIHKFGFRYKSELLAFAPQHRLVPAPVKKPLSSFPPPAQQVLRVLKADPRLKTDDIASKVRLLPKTVRLALMIVRRRLELDPRAPKWRLPQYIADADQ